MRKIIIWVTLLLVTVVSSQQVYAEMPRLDNQMTIQLSHDNQGQEATPFSVYEISREDYEEALNNKYEMSSEKTNEWLSEIRANKVREVMASSDQKAVFDLPKYSVSQDLNYYVILQSQPDKDELSTQVIYEALPIFLSFENVESDFFEINTKRVSHSSSIYFFKYSSGERQLPLEKAQFVLYRELLDGKREYLMNPKNDSWKPINQLTDAYQFESNKDGLVLIPYLELLPGTYYFEETKAPKGFKITKESQKIPLVVKSDSISGLVMTINAEVLETLKAGQLPQEVIAKGTPRVLNDSIKQPPKKDIPNEEQPKKNVFLPKTGEHMWQFSSVGLALIFIGIIIRKRGKENE